ncbi:short transient receptor potential channel 3 [Biomphalaria glabrata]|nr:short transient receptor potential channel 3 [Biomphalaria glabrata]
MVEATNAQFCSSALPIIFILKSEDCVWKFARAKLWISFIEPGTTLSIPFDIIPTPIAVVRLFQGLRNVFLINR